MRIVERTLTAFELSTGQSHRIEANADDTIHLHMGNVRLDMSPEEFDHFAEVIAAAETELAAKKGYETDTTRTERA